MRRKIHTATGTSRKPRAKKWTLRAATAGVLAAGSVAALAGPAHAYPASLCAQTFGAGNVYDVDPVRINAQRVDFGDLPHTGPGDGPQGIALICWSNDRRVAIVGRLFYDTPYSGYDASVDLRGFSGTTPGQDWRGLWTVAGSPGAVTNREVRELWSPELGRYADRVHIQLALWQPPTGESTKVVHDSDYIRGD